MQIASYRSVTPWTFYWRKTKALIKWSCWFYMCHSSRRTAVFSFFPDTKLGYKNPTKCFHLKMQLVFSFCGENGENTIVRLLEKNVLFYDRIILLIMLVTLIVDYCITLCTIKTISVNPEMCTTVLKIINNRKDPQNSRGPWHTENTPP